MLRIAGQTAGPIGLNFFVDTWLKKSKIFFFKFFKYFFFHGQRRALQLVYYKNVKPRGEESSLFFVLIYSARDASDY